MPLNVAQLNVTVTADTTAPIENLDNLKVAFEAAKEAAVAMAEQMSQSMQEIGSSSAQGAGLDALATSAQTLVGTPLLPWLQEIAQVAQQMGQALAANPEELLAISNAMRQLISIPLANMLQEETVSWQQVEALLSVLPAELQLVAQAQIEAAQSAEQLTTQETAVRTSFAGMGSFGGSQLMLLNQGLIATGESFGPLNNGLMMMGLMMSQNTTTANMLTTALSGVAIGLSALGIASAAAAAPAQQGLQQLQNELGNVGQSYSDYKSQIDDVKSHAQDLGFTEGQVYQGLANLLRVTPDVNTALDLMGTAEDVARAKGESLAQATFDIARAYEGYGRGLKQFGLDIVFTHNAQAGLTAAQNAAVSAGQHVADAQNAYNNALERQASSGGASAIAQANSLADAQTRLADAQENLTATTQRLAAEAELAAVAQSHLAQATQQLQDAEQRLADDRAKHAIDEEAPATSHAAEAARAISDAQQRLADDQARVQQSMQLTAADYDQAGMAADRVADAQERLALASGGNILSAQEALRTAISQQREELDRLHAKEKESLSDEQTLARDRRDLARAQADLAPAQAKDKQEADRVSLEYAIQIRDATEAVARAQQDVVRAKAQDTAEATMRRVQAEQQLVGALHQVRDAQIAVQRAQQPSGAGAVSSGISVDDAKRRLDAAQKAAAESMTKVADAQAKLRKEQEQGPEAVKQWSEKVKGAAQAAAEGWSGALKRMTADVANWLADFGNAGGRWLALAFPLMFGLEKLGGLLGGGGEAVAGTEASGGIISTLGELAGVALPVIGIVAAIAAVIAILAAAFILAYQHITPFHDAVDVTGRFLRDVFTGAVRGVISAWHDLTKAIEDLVDRGLKFFNDQIKIVNGFMQDHKKEIDDLIDAWHQLMGVISDVAGFIGEILTILWNTTVHPIINFLGPFTLGVLKAAWTSIIGTARIVWDQVVGVFKIARDTIMTIVGVFLDLITGHFGQAWKDITKGVSKLWNDIYEMFSTEIGHLIDSAGGMAGDIGRGFLDGLQSGFSDVYNFFANLPGNIENFFVDAVTWLYNAGYDILTGLYNGANDMWDQVWTWITGIWDAIAGRNGFFADTLTWLYNAGWNLMVGFWNGISDVWNDFWKWAKKEIGNFASDVAGWLGLGSPSRIFRDMGRDTILGFQLGLEDNYGAVHDSLHGFADRLVAQGAGIHIGAGVGGPGSFAPAAAGGGAVYAPQVHLEVHGSVMTERDLVDTVRNGLIANQARSGGTYMPGLTPR
jgi:phage-related protein